MVSPRDRAIARGREIARELLKEAGGGLRLEQVQAHLGGLPCEAVEAMLRDGHLLALPDLDGGPEAEPLVPACQFDAGGTPLPGPSALQATLPPGASGWNVLDLLIGPDGALDGRRPIDLLRTATAKDLRLVVEAARRTGNQEM